jgi:hypothetical protein
VCALPVSAGDDRAVELLDVVQARQLPEPVIRFITRQLDSGTLQAWK